MTTKEMNIRLQHDTLETLVRESLNPAARHLQDARLALYEAVSKLKNGVDGWTKMPSVTYGGKPYFWFRYTSEGKREWFVWSRANRQWEYHTGA